MPNEINQNTPKKKFIYEMKKKPMISRLFEKKVEMRPFSEILIG